jgi:hypothetical protein
MSALSKEFAAFLSRISAMAGERVEFFPEEAY